MVSLGEGPMRFWEKGIFFSFRVKCSIYVWQISFFLNLYNLTVSLFSFCFNDLSVGKGGVLKSPTIIVWGSMCVLSFSKVSFMNLGALAIWGHRFSELRLSPGGFSLWWIWSVLPYHADNFWLKIYFIG
jgi:hypothetical protein